jgi:DNA repair exonuclease SbcCD ATPase subunit
MIGNSELLSAVNELFEEYKEFERSSREELIAGLEVELDEFIEGGQRAKIRLERIEGELLEEMRRHQKAQDKLANVTEEYRQIVEHIENAEGLFTRAQQAKRERQREEARQRRDEVSMEESLATTAYNNTVQRKNQASVAAAEWENAAHQLQGELKALKGGRKEDHPQTGFQVG